MFAAMRRKREITAFYAPPPVGSDGVITLDADEAHHARDVCRFKAGDPVTVVDGAGLAHFCEILTSDRSVVTCRVFKTVKNWGEPPVAVTLAAGLSKSTKFDLTCEKATELGATAIIPFTSEKSAVKADTTAARTRRRNRYARLVLAAMKQCQRSRLPEVRPIQLLSELIESFDSYHRILVADASQGCVPFTGCGPLIKSARRVLILVGPESGFSIGELQELRESGATSVSLGPRRLRTETAAITFLARIMGLFE